MMTFLEEKIASLGTSACPPYHLALVVGGLSAEQTLKTVKYASARYYDNLPTRCAPPGFRLQALVVLAGRCWALLLTSECPPTAGAPAAARSETWAWKRRCTR